jgi:hypothetical protein
MRIIWGPVMDCCDHGNEPPRFVKYGTFIDMKDCDLYS